MKELIGTTLGQYEIKEKIGQGGMAYVFKAYQPALDRIVAVKVLAPTLTEEPGFTERFQREAHTVARLDHPNILQVYDFGVVDNLHYLAMRYVEKSRTLGDVIREQSPLAQLINFIVQVADALNYAHAEGIIHRDVKPSNILIDGRWALLSDFGMAKMTETTSQLTGTGVGMGTPAYMSPAQAAGKKLDHRTDIYSLGVILYRVLTGKIPHNVTTPLATLVKRSSEPVIPLRQIKPDIPVSLEHVALRALAIDPNARYSTAADFARALKQASADPGYREATILSTADATMLSSAAAPVPTKRSNLGLIIGGAIAAVVIVLGLIIFALGGGPQTAGPTSTPTGAAIGVVTDTIAPVTDTPIPTATSTPILPGTPSAIAKTNLAVRLGPGEAYDLIGYLPEGASAAIISQDETGEWWQIKTSLTGTGLGWINAAEDFSEAADTDNVPIALAPPTPTPTGISTPAPDTPTVTPTTVADTPTSTPTPTRLMPTATPTWSSPPAATATKVPAVPTGQFTLLKPNSVDEPTFGLTEFEWQWGSPLAENQGFEVRVWRDGEPPAGVHNAVLDNKTGQIQAVGNNIYRLVVDITDAPGVLQTSGEYNWTVILVQIEPEYKDLGIQADPPGRLRFEVPGGGGSDGGGGKSGPF